MKNKKMEIDKTKLQAIAKTYIGTPHIAGASIKGAGMDCCGLICSVLNEAGVAKITPTAEYNPEWYLQKNHTEYIYDGLTQQFEKMPTGEILKPGDVITYRFGRSDYAHAALYIGDGLIIHSDAEHGTQIDDIETQTLRKRQTAIWRIK